MAKKFAGFKQEAMEKKILPALGYTGPMDQKSVNAFLASNPGAAAKMGRYTLAARQRIEGVKGMAYGGIATKKGYAEGGLDMNQVNTQQPAQMAAQDAEQQNLMLEQQTNNQSQANGLMQGPEPTEQQIAMRDADNAFMKSPVIMAAQEAQKALEKQAMQQAGLSGPPASQEEAERFRAAMAPLVENSPELKAARDAQNTFNSEMQNKFKSANPQVRPKPLTDYDTSTADVIAKRNALSAAQQAAAQNPEDEALKKAMEDAQIELTRSQAAESQARANLAELTKGDSKLQKLC